jgi:hypothetical protein
VLSSWYIREAVSSGYNTDVLCHCSEQLLYIMTSGPIRLHVNEKLANRHDSKNLDMQLA